MEYCRNLQFEEKPDYNYLRKLFKNLLKIKKQKLDNKFDWDLIK